MIEQLAAWLGPESPIGRLTPFVAAIVALYAGVSGGLSLSRAILLVLSGMCAGGSLTIYLLHELAR